MAFVVSGLVGIRFDLIEHLVLFDMAAFIKKAVANDSADLGAHFGFEKRTGPTNEIGCEHNPLWFQGDNAYFRNGCGTLSLLLFFLATNKE